MPNDTLQRTKSCVAEVLALDPGQIGDTASLVNDLGADSLDLVELMFVLERQFGVRLSQYDLRLTRQLGLTEEEIHVDEVLTPLALERLHDLFPECGAVRERLSDPSVIGSTRPQIPSSFACSSALPRI